MQNCWSFRGEVIYVIVNGKIKTIVIERPDGVGKDGAPKVARCACQTWHDSVPIVGDIIQAEGTISAREYKEKWYCGLMLEDWFLLDVAPTHKESLPVDAKSATTEPPKQAPTMPDKPETGDDIPF
jgi:hypothetical protein